MEGGCLFNFSQIIARLDHFPDTLSAQQDKLFIGIDANIAAPLVLLNVLNMFTTRVRKLKQCTNLRLGDKNYTSFVVSLLIQKMGGGGGGKGALIREGALISNLCQ